MVSPDDKIPKPPYTAEIAIDSLFERIGTLKAPATIDTSWAETYSLAPHQPASIPTLLRWLGVIDQSGHIIDASIWDKLRVLQSREATLSELVKTSYSAVFDEVDVEQANRETLEAAFVSQYQVGDARRYVKCFLELCRHAGIKLSSTSARGENSNQPRASQRKPQGDARLPARRSNAGSQPRFNQKLKRGAAAANLGLGISISIEIPASWTKDQIAQRVRDVRAALEQA